ncbi:MAG TPA: hypothetical protein VM925_32770 [Labilithrix sp.]|nr:hypothetical protein [Labilithrix sp.]
MNAPYRSQQLVVPRTPTWWAGGIAYASLVLAAVLWIGTLVGGYHSESWGMLGAELAVLPTGFGVGCLLLARRTRYAPDAAARVVAPLVLGALSGGISFILLVVFFATVWTSL